MLFRDIHEVHVDKGQLYKVTAFADYTRKDGTLTKMAVLQSFCAECGTPFTFRVPQSADEIKFRRRCDKHKKPGVRVSNKSWIANVLPFTLPNNVFD